MIALIWFVLSGTASYPFEFFVFDSKWAAFERMGGTYVSNV